MNEQCHCGSRLIPDASADELRAGKLRLRCASGGHSRYRDVDPVRSEAEARVDAIIQASVAKQRDLGYEPGPDPSPAQVCDICLEPMGADAGRGRKRHPRCVPAAKAAVRQRSAERSSRSRSEWTPARKDRFSTLWNAGAPVRVIAEAVGVDRRSVSVYAALLRSRDGLALARRPHGGVRVRGGA